MLEKRKRFSCFGIFGRKMYSCPECNIMHDVNGKSKNPAHCSRKEFLYDGSYDAFASSQRMCCNCRIRGGDPEIRCSQCLKRPLRDVEDRPMPGSPPEGINSISIENLELLLDDLQKDLTSQDIIRAGEQMSSEHIRTYLKGEDGSNRHPAKEPKWQHLFSKEPAQAVLSYTWSLPLSKTSGVLKYLKSLNKRKLTIWIDVLFVDQLSQSISLDLGKAQEYYAFADMHIAILCECLNKDGIMESMLDRGWCLFELIIRNKARKKTFFIGDAKALKAEGFNYLDQMKCHPNDSDALFALKAAYDFRYYKADEAIAAQCSGIKHGKYLAVD